MSRSETSSGDVNSISLDHIPSMIMEYPRRIVLGLCMILRRRQIAQGNHERVLKSDTTAKRRTNKAACRALLETSFGLSKKVSTSQLIVTEDGSLGTEKRGLSKGHMCRQVSEMGTTELAKADHQSQPRRRAGGMTMRQLWKSVVLVFFHLLILVDLCSGCGPGRGAGRRRAPRKLTPLVYKQHVPNVPENTLSASGLNEGKINRDHPRFKALVPNYNSDIIFRDDEGTGADRLMTQRCKEKLNTLAISVMNQWPGVRLRVIEGWDEGNHHSTSSLHYEGRAVDITTSDKDRSKYGMLARLAVEAGFDWVYYESRAHIHCSVKSDSSQAARTGGCFSSNATVNTPEGSKKITDVKPGDSIQSMNEEGKPIFSEVLMFLDKNASETREFYHVTTSSGASMALTPSHLMFKVDRIIGESIAKISEELSDMEAKEVYNSARVTFAKHIEAGDWLLVVKNSHKVRLERVVRMEADMSTGVYAPLTKQGNVVVDGILASCYAVIDDQDLAHLAFSPVRLVVNMYEGFVHAWKQFSNFITFHQPFHSKSALSNSISSNSNDSLNNIQPSAANWRHSNSAEVEQGVHWYASFLYSTTKHLLPSNLLYDHE